MAFAAKLADRLGALPESSAVSLRLRAEHYFDVIRAVLDSFANRKGMAGIYVTATIPSHSIINALQVLEIPIDNIYFVDCISQIMMASAYRHEHAAYVESPTMLENVMLKVEFLTRRAGPKAVVVVDSINSFAIHNNIRILNEFLHILVNNLRSKGAYTVIFSLEEHETEEIRSMMSLVCDETLQAEEGG